MKGVSNKTVSSNEKVKLVVLEIAGRLTRLAVSVIVLDEIPSAAKLLAAVRLGVPCRTMVADASAGRNPGVCGNPLQSLKNNPEGRSLQVY